MVSSSKFSSHSVLDKVSLIQLLLHILSRPSSVGSLKPVEVCCGNSCVWRKWLTRVVISLLASLVECDWERRARNSWATLLDASMRKSAHNDRHAAGSDWIHHFSLPPLGPYKCIYTHVEYRMYMYNCKCLNLQVVMLNHLVERFPSAYLSFHIHSAVVDCNEGEMLW